MGHLKKAREHDWVRGLSDRQLMLLLAEKRPDVYKAELAPTTTQHKPAHAASAS